MQDAINLRTLRRRTIKVQATTGHPYIAIEGGIGVGKTTLVRLLYPRFQASQLLEAFDKNPFLSDFYADRTRYAFQTQIFFLLSRYRQQQTIPQDLKRKALISDYFFAKDKIFAYLNITGDELTMYDRLYDALAEKIRQPDLVVYLRAETDTLMARIAMRDRPYERQMDRGYIAALRRRYDEYFANYDTTPLLIIETDALDFVRNSEDLSEIEQRIRAALSGIHQPSLPDMSTTLSRPAWKLHTIRYDGSPHQGGNDEAPPDVGPAEANWQALGDFLALSEAVGHIGSALSQHPPISPDGAPETLRHALSNAAHALTSLAQRAKVSLEE
jgi:deoxyguanosine kinase